MYKCEVCGKISPPNTPRLLFPIHRTRLDGCEEIEKEVAVCKLHHAKLEAGVPLAVLQRQMRVIRMLEAPQGVALQPQVIDLD